MFSIFKKPKIQDFQGAIRYYKMIEFWKKLSEREKNELNKASNMGACFGMSQATKIISLDHGDFQPPLMFDDKDIKRIEAKIVDFFYCKMGVLVNRNDMLAIKLYEYLIQNHSDEYECKFSLFFLHMNAMKSYINMGMYDLANKAAEKNLMITISLEKEIKRINMRKNHCYHHLKKENPENKYVKIISKMDFRFS